MNCPRCQCELPKAFFESDTDWEDLFTCPRCGKRIPERMVRQLMEPSDCLLVREKEITEDEFSEDWCQDCHAACVLANPESDSHLVQDEEDNWCYPEDLYC